MHRATFTLDTEAYGFLKSFAGTNKSAFINQLLKKEKRRRLQEAIRKANIEEAEDTSYQEELSAWETISDDGLSS
jgi:hypothetical protein